LSAQTLAPADPRLILRPEELDAALEQFLLAEASLWIAADPALEDQPHKLGRGHFRAAFLLKRRPGLGVKDLVRLILQRRAWRSGRASPPDRSDGRRRGV
jgi:hypothetical protein